MPLTHFPHGVDVGELHIGGVEIAAAAAELNSYVLHVEIEAAETAGSHWVVAPFAGNVVDAFSVAYAQHTVADTVITAEIGGTAITGFQITITAGGAAGDVDQTTEITAANAVTAGQAIEVITDGGATAAGRVAVALVIQLT